MYKVFVNEIEYPITLEDNQLLLNGKREKWDMVSIGDNHYHLIKDHKTYQIELLKLNRNNKVIELRINGRKYSASIKDKFDQLLEQLGMNQSNDGRVNQIKAPMPGMILEVFIEKGSQVAKGDKIIVLEAMKMENIIKSPGDGIVKSITVKKGDRVEKNQVLIDL